MFLVRVLAAVAPCMPTGGLPLQPPQECLQEPGIDWFEGSWDELLARAKAEDRLVFVDFWASWCTWCRQFEKKTLSDDAVEAELAPLLCYSVDTESGKGSRIAERYHVRDHPTLLFLDPDGETRDVIVRFQSPGEFLSELRRIKRNEGTLGRLRERIAAHPDDIEAHYALALKLRDLGQKKAYEAEIARIRELDPEGRSLVSRRIRLSAILDEARQSLELGPLYAFLDGESEPQLLYQAWHAVWNYERQRMERSDTPEEAAEHRERWLVAAHRLWEHAPDNTRALVGNNIAWYIYEAREELGAEELGFALSLARKAVAIMPDDPYILDTLACCLFALGKRDEAIRTIHHAIDVDPENPQWRSRLEELRGKALRGG